MISRLTRYLPMVLCAALFASTGACSQRWRFAPPGSLHQRNGTAYVESPTCDSQAVVAQPTVSNGESTNRQLSNANRQSSVLATGPVLSTSYHPAYTPTSYDGLHHRPVNRGPMFVEPFPPVSSSGNTALAVTAADDGQHVKSWSRGNGLFRRGRRGLPWRDEPACPRLREGFCLLRCKVCHDYDHFYCWSTGRDILLSIAAGSLLANTSMDQDFRNWVQDDIRSDDTDNFCAFWKTFGEGEIFIPAFAGLGIAGWLLKDWPVCDAAGTFGGRTTRAYLVGVPPVLFLQAALGGSRPGETRHESAWRPFEDNNGVSGHAFVGSVPFITAGNMCENPYAAGCFYFMSTLPAWSRINDDAHYLSQAMLGWWIGYLACRSVDETEAVCEGRYRFSVTPLCGANTAGVMAVCKF